MNSEELLHIIKQGENHHTEFKKKFNDDTIISLAAFANSKGEKLLVGVF